MKKRKLEILSKIKKCVQAIEPEAEVILFGSQARGDEHKHSDWDILILTPYPVGLKEEQEYRHKLFELELEYGQAFSTFVYSQSEWNTKHKATPLYQNIQKEGVRV